MASFRVRLNCIDHYQGSPTELEPPLFQNLSQRNGQVLPKVPIIRVFGSTPTGQKVCVHVHGAFPYLYIEYRDGLATHEVRDHIQRLYLAVNHALAISYRRTTGKQPNIYVAHIELIRGTPFYGYHVGYCYFLKIYLLDPAHITRLADLLRQGAVLMRPFQPYESHMQYVPQWMCDYNLYGCAYLDCNKFSFRSPVPVYQDVQGFHHKWHDRSIATSMISDPTTFPRQSHCPLEIDISVEDIANRQDIPERRIHHDFVEQTHPNPGNQKLVHSMTGLWRDETRRRRERMGLKDSDGSPFPAEVLISVSADPRNTSPGGWIHEEEYRRKVELEIMNEREGQQTDAVSFQDFVECSPEAEKLKTAFESVTDLFPSRFSQQDSLIAEETLSNEENEIHSTGVRAEVDEARILALHDEGLSNTDEEKEIERAPTQVSIMRNAHLNEHVASLGGGLQPAADREPGGTGVSKGGMKPGASSKDLQVYPGLELMGVRRVEDTSQSEDDDFEIGTDYRSRIQASVESGEILDYVKGQQEESPKQQKHFQHRKDVLTMEIPEAREKLRLPDTALLSDEDTQPDASSPAFLHRSNIKSSSDHLAEPLLQPGTKVTDDTKLSFPVVKDPQNPYTIQKLSQRSQDSRNSQRAKEERSLVGAPDVFGVKTIGFLKGSSGTRLTNQVASNAPTSQTLQLMKNVASGLLGELDLQNPKNHFCYAQRPPCSRRLLQTFKHYNLPTKRYQDAYYADEADVPEVEREYAGKGFKLESTTVPFLPDFNPRRIYYASLRSNQRMSEKQPRKLIYRSTQRTCSIRHWEIEDAPPAWRDIANWIRLAPGISHDHPTWTAKPEERSQIESATQKHRHGFKYTQKQADTSVRHETQYMSLMSLEVHVNTRGNLVPDPEKDAISCVFWCLQLDGTEKQLAQSAISADAGILVVAEAGTFTRQTPQHVKINVHEEETELDLMNRMIDIVRDHDPDILTGFEVHNSSWGYLIERARRQYDYDLCEEFSRTKSSSHGRIGKALDPWGFNHTSTIRITGRHMINIWRAMRGELNLLQYTLENIVFHVLHRRVPHYAFSDLTEWYQSGNARELARVVDYYMERTQLDVEILEQNELIPRTSEQARLLGVDFCSVFSRGSQFKVESLMFRIAKPENFLLVSPSRKQVGQQNALECLPLVMEPQSAFYSSPLLVLDFQSLYPSVMIAYNYCYSTFLGRVVAWQGQNKMGFRDFARQHRLLELLKDHINVAPNGMIYVRPEIRKSLLAKMLGEILETRVMVKSGMKVDKDDKTLQRLLNNRQLALKLIANVTYGYTSASFSGRMPCSEIADSIVQTGRETLEKAIALIHSVKRWGAEVVYGDTDSLFVYLEGRTRDEAFNVGSEIAKAVTAINPRPVKLKFEKVYHPCVLLAKKRYVGFKYESKAQKKPEFDAKGIETVRRDGTPAEQKIEEKALKILFHTANLSAVKDYFQRQCTKIMKGQVSIQDFCFAREVKLGTYNDRGPPPPGALISTRRMLEDPRAEPQYGERVPYVVIAGAPGARLIDRCVAPNVLLEDDQHDLDAEYYITKNIIPPLERIFNLVGANVRQWYDEMPKHQKVRKAEISHAGQSKEVIVAKKTMESYLIASACIVCRTKLEETIFPLCSECLEQPGKSLLKLRQRSGSDDRKGARLQQTCRSCAGLPFGDQVRCRNRDCPVFYARTRHMALVSSNRGIMEPMMELFEDADDEFLVW